MVKEYVEEDEDREEGFLDKVKSFFITVFWSIVIFAVWLVIMGFLIHADVNSVGSELVAPLLYNTKANWILPTGSIEHQQFLVEYRKKYPKDYSKRPQGSVETLDEAKVYVEDLQDYCEQLEDENDKLHQQLIELQETK